MYVEEITIKSSICEGLKIALNASMSNAESSLAKSLKVVCPFSSCPNLLVRVSAGRYTGLTAGITSDEGSDLQWSEHSVRM